MSLQVVVDGQWLASIAGWGNLKWGHAADGGCKDASWQMSLPDTFNHPALRRGARVQIKAGPANLWQGILTEPDIADEWTFNAVGLGTLGRSDFLALDASLNASMTPNVAVDQAILRGLPWTRPTSLSASAYVPTTATDGLLYVGQLLDQWADTNGLRWGVNADAEVYAKADATVPAYYLAPSVDRLGLADDDYASDLFVRYVASGGSYATATVADTTARSQFGRREYPVDATGGGLLTAAGAQSYAVGLLAKGKARQGFTNGVTASKYQLRTPGGQPAYLPFVKAGDLIRQHGVVDTQGQPTQYLDWVIGETQYEAGAETIALTPVGLVPRVLTDVLSASGAA